MRGPTKAPGAPILLGRRAVAWSSVWVLPEFLLPLLEIIPLLPVHLGLWRLEYAVES